MLAAARWPARGDPASDGASQGEQHGARHSERCGWLDWPIHRPRPRPGSVGADERSAYLPGAGAFLDARAISACADAWRARRIRIAVVLTLARMSWSDQAVVVMSPEQAEINAKARKAMAALKEIATATLPPLPSEVAERGSCKGLPPTWFFGKRGSSGYAIGRRICAACPVATACREWARAQPVGALVGLWGGESQRERRMLRESQNRGARKGTGRDDCEHRSVELAAASA